MNTTNFFDPLNKPTQDPATREFEFAGHVFVWARPKHKPWREYDGTNLSLKHVDFEFRPCKLSGHGSGRSLYVIGSPYSHSIDDFEIAEDAARS